MSEIKDQAAESQDLASVLGTDKDQPLSPVPLEERQHWVAPAMIFGGLEFCIPILMVGGTLAGSFSLSNILLLLFIGLVVIQWPGNAFCGYIGAKTGLSSSVIARKSFGSSQARVIVGGVIFIASLGWWAVQTAVAGNAICAMLNIDYKTQYTAWALVTVIVGFSFAIPSIIGYSSMKWTDYVAVPAGLILVLFGIYLSMKNVGVDAMMKWSPKPTMSFLVAVSLILSMNVSQWVIAADYTRYAQPTVRDNLKIPMGIVGVGFPLFFVGAVMSIGVGTGDIVQVMTNLGFPIWGFLVLYLSTWTSQLVNNYSMGLALSNLLNIRSGRGRAVVTFIGTIIAIGVALAGILDHFMDFLFLTALVYPCMAGIMFADFLMPGGDKWADNPGWRWQATVTMVLGIALGYYTQYVHQMGLPALQSLLFSMAVYWACSKLSPKTA